MRGSGSGPVGAQWQPSSGRNLIKTSLNYSQYCDFVSPVISFFFAKSPLPDTLSQHMTKTSTPIGAWKFTCSSFRKLRQTEQPTTNQPIDLTTNLPTNLLPNNQRTLPKCGPCDEAKIWQTSRVSE